MPVAARGDQFAVEPLRAGGREIAECRDDRQVSVERIDRKDILVNEGQGIRRWTRAVIAGDEEIVAVLLPEITSGGTRVFRQGSRGCGDVVHRPVRELGRDIVGYDHKGASVLGGVLPGELR